jgi:MATE family multidrug resistance protein
VANMTANITCFAPFLGMVTSLDTLCSQAYGSGQKHLVGIYCQRMAMFLLCLSIPVAVLWILSENIVMNLVANAESARLTALYLRVMIFAIPGFALFETGKRFLQAQGLFVATTYILLITAPLNMLLSWLFVWKLEFGFIGAPLAVAVSRTLLPILLVLYVRYFRGMQCWGGLTKRALSNWRPMICLAVPGMVMVEAEWLAFEVMAVLSSRFGTEYLAAQSVIISLATISYQVPFAISIAASTRIANLVGAGQVDASKVAAKVVGLLPPSRNSLAFAADHVQAFGASSMISSLNLIIYVTLGAQLCYVFTDDPDVVAVVTQVLPVVGVTTFFDAFSTVAHGLLRGIGQQAIGGIANLFAYYVVCLPISVGLGFGLNMKLEGLWIGITVGLIRYVARDCSQGLS